jgi:DNA polymerase III alpha subunit
MAGKKYRTVMLIDDNEIDNLINQKMIEAASVTENIYTHTGAKSAIEFLKNMEKLDVADQVLPDIIFLDIDMPLMDGFQFLDEFEKLTNIADISSSKGNIRVACIFRSIKAIKTKTGKPMAFANIYDDSGEVEITIFSTAYENSYDALKKNQVVIIDGYYNSQREEFNVLEISKLEDINNG